jgi:hypothetical protein
MSNPGKSIAVSKCDIVIVYRDVYRPI